MSILSRHNWSHRLINSRFIVARTQSNLRKNEGYSQLTTSVEIEVQLKC